jgi:hypothetical protein
MARKKPSNPSQAKAPRKPGRGNAARRAVPAASPAPAGAPQSSRPASRTRVARFTDLRPMYDYWGQELKRYYKLETLANATEHRLARQDTFIVPSVQQVLGRTPVTSMVFRLFQEGRYQLIFQMTAANTRKKKASFAFVVAKKDGELSALAAAEHRHLQMLHPRAPDWVVRPYLGGTLYFPDRYGRSSHARDIYAYLTHWLSGYHELGIDRSHQFFINVHPHRLLTRVQTEALKTQMVAIIARLYDPEKRVSIAMPELASGDFVVTAPDRKGRQALKLIACRKLLANIRPGRLVHLILTAGGMWAEKRFHLAPADPADVAEGLIRGVGEPTALQWVRAYLDDVERRRFPEQAHFPRSAARELLGD